MSGQKQITNNEQFIAVARQIHSDLYSYEKSVYTRSREKVEIICSIHGSFFQSPNNHISKHVGCPKCGFIRMTNWNTGRPGKKKTEESKEAFSRYAKKHNFGKWMKGRKIPRETIEKTIANRAWYRPSIETKEKISKANSGPKNGMFGKHHTEEVRRIISRHNVERLSNIHRSGFYNTKPERQMEKILSELNIQFKKQIPFQCYTKRWFCVDFYIESSKTVIEVDGTYWHNYPYGNECDHVRTRFLLDNGYRILRFWENKFDLEKVKREISNSKVHYEFYDYS